MKIVEKDNLVYSEMDHLSVGECFCFYLDIASNQNIFILLTKDEESFHCYNISGKKLVNFEIKKFGSLRVFPLKTTLSWSYNMDRTIDKE